MRTIFGVFLLVALGLGQARAAFVVTDQVTSINGVAVGGAVAVDSLGNVLQLSSYSMTGLVDATPSAGFTASTLPGSFHAGTDNLTATITVANQATGHSLVFQETIDFLFQVVAGQNFVQLDINNPPKVTFNGVSNPFATYMLDGVRLDVGSYIFSGTGGDNANTDNFADFGTNVTILPEPSSFVLAGIAGVVGLAAARIRRRRGA